jgi:preprotein translocase subunit SecE
MNREQKRMLQRQGALTAEGSPTRAQPRTPVDRSREPRTPLPEFIREVKGELRKVAWPTKAEVRKYSIVVLITVIILTAFVSGLDWALGSTVLKLFER